ncbi:Myc-type, basic helix-loop-helix domain-containing protein [Tanacetum coccineum]
MELMMDVMISSVVLEKHMQQITWQPESAVVIDSFHGRKTEEYDGVLAVIPDMRKEMAPPTVSMSLSFQPRTYNLSTLPFRDSVQIWKFPENKLDVLKFPDKNLEIREKKVRYGCSEDLFSLAYGPTSACTYPACIVNGVKFVVHEHDILHTTQCSGFSTPGLDGEIRYYIDQGIHHILTDREFHKNNQYILATQATQVFYLQDLARQPRGWKVVEHVYHRDVAESDQDVIHGSSSSHVTLSVGLTCLEHTDLSINAQSTEVDAPPVNDDNANANEDNADFINNEDDVVAHVLDDDDVVVSDDDEVNPSTNVEEVLSSDDSDDDN